MIRVQVIRLWVCIWIWYGLASALVPSANTVTTPEAANIVGASSNALSLENLRTEDAIFAHYDTEPNFNWSGAIAFRY